MVSRLDKPNVILEEVLRQMFKVVDAPFPEDMSYFQKPEWFHDHSWTQDQQDQFAIYLRDMMMVNFHYTKKMATHAAQEFVFNYGWRINDIHL